MQALAFDGAPPATPIVKWAGGKTKLLATLRELRPAHFRRYLEPFAGGAAHFFDVLGTVPTAQAVLSDTNQRLIGLYRAVANHLPALVEELERLAADHGPDHYLATRAQFNAASAGDELTQAARFLYLNKTCFNGLYRVNRRGHFNVPMGRYKRPRILDVDALTRASGVLRRAELRCTDFGEVLRSAGDRDFVYLDPPYVPLTKTACFTSYSACGFGPADQERLATAAHQAAAAGACVVLSNHDTETVRALYPRATFRTVQTRRAINARADRRSQTVTEVLIRL